MRRANTMCSPRTLRQISHFTAEEPFVGGLYPFKQVPGVRFFPEGNRGFVRDSSGQVFGAQGRRELRGEDLRSGISVRRSRFARGSGHARNPSGSQGDWVNGQADPLTIIEIYQNGPMDSMWIHRRGQEFSGAENLRPPGNQSSWKTKFRM